MESKSLLPTNTMLLCFLILSSLFAQVSLAKPGTNNTIAENKRSQRDAFDLPILLVSWSPSLNSGLNPSKRPSDNIHSRQTSSTSSSDSSSGATTVTVSVPSLSYIIRTVTQVNLGYLTTVSVAALTITNVATSTVTTTATATATVTAQVTTTVIDDIYSTETDVIYSTGTDVIYSTDIYNNTVTTNVSTTIISTLATTTTALTSFNSTITAYITTTNNVTVTGSATTATITTTPSPYICTFAMSRVNQTATYVITGTTSSTSYAYYQVFAGSNFVETDGNPGNANVGSYTPMTTSYPAANTYVESSCASFAASLTTVVTGSTNAAYSQYYVYSDSSKNSWYCKAYYNVITSPFASMNNVIATSYYQVNTTNAPCVYGYQMSV